MLERLDLGYEGWTDLSLSEINHKTVNMKDTTTALIVGLILGIIIGAFGGYQYAKHQDEDSIRIRIGAWQDK